MTHCESLSWIHSQLPPPMRESREKRFTTPPLSMRENGTICPFVFFPAFNCIAFFTSKLSIPPLKRSVLGVRKGQFRARKDKWWIQGSKRTKTPKPLEMPIKQGQASQDHNWPRYRDRPQIGAKIAKYKTGGNAKRTNGSIFTRPQPPPPFLARRHFAEEEGAGIYFGVRVR